MIVDSKGNLFEDRRKNKDRRCEENGRKVSNEKRKEDRRKAPNQIVNETPEN